MHGDDPEAVEWCLNPTTDVWEIPTLNFEKSIRKEYHESLNPTTDFWEIPTGTIDAELADFIASSQSHH